MNRVLVAQAAAGFAAYLNERAAPGTRPTVVIGYDGRKNSGVFATDSAEIFAGAGLRAILLPRLLPTPVLAFAVRHLGADAGVMVTASHNPPNDNGYKVYLGGADGGSQIVAPADAEIAAHIERVAERGRRTRRSPARRPTRPRVRRSWTRYVAATAAVAPAPVGTAGLRWVYTAMHGVGWETFSRILGEAGYPAPWTVSEQRDPDPTFPHGLLPQPGGARRDGPRVREGAHARRGARDRERPGRGPARRRHPRRVRGRRLAPAHRQRGRPAARLARRPRGHGGRAAARGTSLACSLVSSPALRAIAERYGLGFHETLTGFKWISRAPGIAFGFEEALGYLVNPETVRDKDGISAAIALLGLAAEARGREATIADLLDELAAEIGSYASGQVSIRVEDVTVIGRIMAALREDPPAVFGDTAVAGAEDLLLATGGRPRRRRAALPPRGRLPRHRAPERHRAEAQGRTSTRARTRPRRPALRSPISTPRSANCWHA